MSSASETSLGSILEGMSGQLTVSGALLPGASLILAIHCLRRGAVEAGLSKELSSYLELSEEDVRGVVSFAERLREPGEMLVLCHGVSCSLHGARAFHDLLLQALAFRDPTLGQPPVRIEPDEVSCLGHCETGPNIRIGNRTYLACSQVVVTEERGWHDAPD